MTAWGGLEEKLNINYAVHLRGNCDVIKQTNKQASKQTHTHTYFLKVAYTHGWLMPYQNM